MEIVVDFSRLVKVIQRFFPRFIIFKKKTKFLETKETVDIDSIVEFPFNYSTSH